MSREHTPNSSSSSDSECTEGEIIELNKWLDNTPNKVARTLHRIARSKSFDNCNKHLKTMASPFKETKTPQLPIDFAPEEQIAAAAETLQTTEQTEGGNNGTEGDNVEASGDQKEGEIVDENSPAAPEAASATVEDGAAKKKTEGFDSDEESEEQKKWEEFIEDKISELPQEDRPEVTLQYEANGRVPTHDNGKIHVIPPNRGHEGHQKDAFYGAPPYAKDIRVWYSWPHSDPGKSVKFGFISCEKPFFVEEVGEDCYTIDHSSAISDNEEDRVYYEKCLFPASRLHYYHEKNRMAVTRQGRTRVSNPKNWEGLPHLKDLPRGTVVVRNGLCFKILSHVEHVSGVWAQLCHEDGTVIGGPADADLLHYETDFKAPSNERKALMMNSITAAEVQKTKTALVLGKILRAETQKRKHRKPYKRETFNSRTKSDMKSEAAHQSTFAVSDDQVTKDREMARFGGRRGPSSIASSQDTKESDKLSEAGSQASLMVSKQKALQTENANRTLALQNEALRKECDQLKTAFAEVMSTVNDMQKEKDAKLTEEVELSRQQALEKSFPLEAALLEHYKQQKETADKEKTALVRQANDLQKALEMQRSYVVQMKDKMKSELEKIKEKTGETSEQAPAVLRSVTHAQELRGATQNMLKGRQQMMKLEEMLKTATHQCIEAGIAVPDEMLNMVRESEQKEPPRTLTERSVRFEDEDQEQNARPSATGYNNPATLESGEVEEGPTTSADDEMEEGEIGVDDDAKNADAEMLTAERDQIASAEKPHSPRTGISVVPGEDGFYYDKDNNAYAAEDVLKINDGLNIVRHPNKPKIVSTVTLLAAKKKKQIETAIQSVVGAGSSTGREETRRSLFKDDANIETYDIDRFNTATPENESECMLFPSPIDSGDDLNMTSDEFNLQNRYNDRKEKSDKLEALSIQKHQEKLEHVRRVAEAEMAALQSMRQMEIAQRASHLRSNKPPFLIESIPDDDVQKLRELDAKLEEERAKLRDAEQKEADTKQKEKERRAEERRRKREEKEKRAAEAEAQRARDHEEELRRQQQIEHDLKERKRRDKEEKRRMKEYERSGDRSVDQLLREAEFAERERVRKAELDREGELAALRIKYQRLLDDKSSPTPSEASNASSRPSRKRPADDGDSDDDLRKKARKEKKPINTEIDRLLEAKRAELQSLKMKSGQSASAARPTPEATGGNPRFRGNRIPDTGYVQPVITPPFEVARRPGKTENKATFLYPNEAVWRWMWSEFTTIRLKVVSRKSLESNQVNVNEYQAMQLAAGFVANNLSRMDNFATKEGAYNELRQAIEAVQAMADGNMRQVRAVIPNRDLRDAIIQAALMTNVQNGADYRIVALKQLQHIRNSLTNKFHYDSKRQAKASASGGGAAGGTASQDSSESGD